jgi:opacity protein-like surface antigen
MMGFGLGRTLLVIVVALCLSNGAMAADADDDWQFRLTPYLWGLAIEGDMEVRGQKVELDAGFGDIFDQLNFAFQGRFEAQKRKLTLFLDSNYAELEDEARIGPIEVTNGGTMFIQEFGATYELYRGEIEGRPLVLEALGGGRYWYVKAEIDGGPFSLEKSKDWVDPFVGARIALGLTERWMLGLRTDVGGFGIGSAADLAWHVRATLHYRLSERWRLLAAYVVLDLDFDSGLLEADLTFQGPAVAVEFNF